MNGRTLLVCCSLAVVMAVAIHGTSGASAPNGRVALGGNCTENSNCSAPNSLCTNKKCACDTGYEVNGTTCTIKLNSSCNYVNRICNRTGATCNNGNCTCRTDHVISTNGQNCLPVANGLYDVCTETRQCTQKIANSICNNGHCVCSSGQFETGGRCSLITCSGGCSSLGLAQCVGSSCVCNANTLQYSDGCFRPIGAVDATCSTVNWERCYLSADGYNQNVNCVNGKCTCNKGYKANKQKTRCSGASTTVASIIFVLMAAVVSFRA